MRRFVGGKPVLGLVLALPLGDGSQGYGRVLPDGMEVFTRRDPLGTQPDLLTLVEGPRAFRHWVSYAAVRSRRWEALGVVPLTEQEESDRLSVWRVDAETGFAYRYSWDPVRATLGTERLTRKQCTRMELASVMDDVHVEERLRNFFEGRPYLDDLLALARVKDP